MSVPEIFMTVFLLMTPFANRSEASIVAPALPVRIQVYLHKNYPGWKLTSIADGCSPEFRRAVDTGDFDGDGRRDYLVKFIKRNKGYIMAFLERRDGYEAHVLHRNKSVAEIKNTGIRVFRRGEQVPTEDLEDEGSYHRLLNDAPFDGPCESDAGGVHIYQDGKFKAI